MRVLVTGTAGFIGFHLCLRLIKEGFSVIGFDNLNDYYDKNLKEARLKELYIANQRYDADVEKVDNNPFSMAMPYGLRNITGTRDTPKDDGFHIDSNGKYTFTKAYDFTDESDLAGAGGGATGYFALKYAEGKPALMRSLESGESPTMNIRLHIPVRKRRKRNRRGRVVESTWSRLKKHR